MRLALQVIDGVLLSLGGLCLVGFAIWLARRGRWRNPLADKVIPRSGPGLAAVGAVVLLFLTVQLAGLDLLMRDQPHTEVLQPGSHVWHLGQCADAIAKALASAVMVVLLVRAGTLPDRGSHAGLWRGIAAGLTGFVVLIPLIVVQWMMGTILWRWLHPAAEPPVHGVLLAVQDSAWGQWGVVQLVIGALLLAPLAEELFFRGLVLQVFCRYLGLGWVAIAGSALLFGLVHAQPQDVLPLVTMGLVLGYIRLSTGRLWPCILVHVLFNARTMTFALLAPELLRTG